jgi:hypothetical protein
VEVLPQLVMPKTHTLGDALSEWIPRLLEVDPPTQKRMLVLFDLLQPMDAVSQWAVFWHTLSDLDGRARALGASLQALSRSGSLKPVQAGTKTTRKKRLPRGIAESGANHSDR